MAHFDIGNRLALYGYKGEVKDFDRILANLWWLDYASTHKTVEGLLHNCMSARNFCDEVRRKTCIWIEDYEILTRLTNLRKDNFLDVTKPA